MPARNPLLQEFLTSVAEVFGTIALGQEAARTIDRIGSALQSTTRAGAPAARRLQVCRHLDGALATARAASPSLGRVADAFAAFIVATDRKA